jgi:hypothetical protein
MDTLLEKLSWKKTWSPSLEPTVFLPSFQLLASAGCSLHGELLTRSESQGCPFSPMASATLFPEPSLKPLESPQGWGPAYSPTLLWDSQGKAASTHQPSSTHREGSPKGTTHKGPVSSQPVLHGLGRVPGLDCMLMLVRDT